ncbi:MAG TPA: c-type cytochrome [Bryobacteraceae bacterium]|nr:c-type cytochrome [Bryobacteraceae bacterium]
MRSSGPKIYRLVSIAVTLSFALCSAQQVGQQQFARCETCHGLDGRGGEHAPNIATDPKIQALSDRDLIRIVRSGIPSAGMPEFGSSLDASQIHAVVDYLRILQGQRKAAVAVTGDPEHGRLLFFGSAGCSDCHTVDGQGGFLGADLSNYGGVHAPAEIREAIVDPNQNLDPRHGTVVVVTKTGETFTGVLRNEDNFSLQMQTADGSFHFFDKADLARVEHPAKSLMPSQYESKLGSKNLDDLISYLMKSAAKGQDR